MPLKRIYAHWLDPELMSSRFPSWMTREQRYTEHESLLKLLALLGYSIRLSDVQLIDSFTILRLFSDLDFLTFLQSDPFRDDSDLAFLRLVAKPCDWDFYPLDLRVLTSGLWRAVEAKSWSSSTFADPTETKKIGEMLKRAKSRNMHDALRLFENNEVLGLHRRQTSDPLIRGMINGLEFFVQFPKNIEESPAPTTKSYYDVLVDSLGKLSTKDSLLKLQLEKTLEYAEKSGNKYQRTPAVLGLANSGLARPENLVPYLHIIQAWNYGVSGSVGANLDSGVGLGIPSIAHLHGVVDNWTVPFDALNPKEPFEYCFGTKWHPSMTPWAQVGKLRAQCKMEILRFQGSLSTGNAWTSFTELIEAIADKEASRLGSFPQVPQQALRLAEVVRTTGAIAICFMGLAMQGPNSGILDPKTVLSIITAMAQATSLPEYARNFWFAVRGKDSVKGDLESMAARYNLYRKLKR